MIVGTVDEKMMFDPKQELAYWHSTRKDDPGMPLTTRLPLFHETQVITHIMCKNHAPLFRCETQLSVVRT